MAKLTKEALEAIRERASQAMRGNPLIDAKFLMLRNQLIIEDIPKLLAEVERLRSELTNLCPIGDLDTINTLRVELAYMQDVISERDAEVERLRAGIYRVTKHTYCDDTHEYLNRLLNGEETESLPYRIGGDSD